MRHHKIFCFFSLFLLFPWSVYAQGFNLNLVSKTELMKHVNFLASDSLQGRGLNSTFPAADIAADYLVTTISETGLQFKEENYSQNFNLITTRRDDSNTFLKIFSNRKEKVIRSDQFTVLNQNSEIVEIAGEPVFAGFGWKDEASGYNDLNGLDMNNKVVLVSAGTPETFAKEFSNLWNYKLERNKTDLIFSAGARAVILITHAQDAENKTFKQIARFANKQNYSLEKKVSGNTTNFVIATPVVADAILGEKGRWKKALQKVIKKEEPLSFKVKNKIQLTSVRKTEEIRSRNVIGFLEGSDPVLKEECVVFVAHYDHIGINEKGEIFNGADDNASGTSALLEVARAFSLSSEKPKRSIVFLWVTAEEVGLIGSEYYSKNPVFPLEKTVACINLDMVGRVYEPRDSVWAHSPKQVKPFNEIYALVNDFNPDLKKITEANCATLGLIPDFSLPDNFFYSSDHYHFHRNKVPVLNLSTGYTADYHQPTDEADRINFDKMKKVAELCVLLGISLANN